MNKGKIKYESLWTSRKLQMVSIFIFLIYLSGDTKLWVEADTRRMWYAFTNLQLYLGTKNRKYGYLWILILSKWFMTVINYALNSFNRDHRRDANSTIYPISPTKSNTSQIHSAESIQGRWGVNVQWLIQCYHKLGIFSLSGPNTNLNYISQFCILNLLKLLHMWVHLFCYWTIHLIIVYQLMIQ